ncbi:hypothetical protein FRC19_002695 [Serendipita sp. 401]|nr:hypothetical protein FRC19_002695 [Serendipita sp. 401]
MAKRANASATPSYQPISAIEGKGRTKESGFQKFMREQVFAPEKIGGNVSIVVGVTFFAASIVATRQWGFLLLVPSA